MKEDFFIETEINGNAFETHARFTDFVLKKKWRYSIVWLAIMGILATGCFILHDREGLIFLGVLFSALGVLFPSSYFLAYFIGVKHQADKIDNDEKKIRYSTRVNNGGFASGFGEIPWENVDKIYFYKEYIYVYLKDQRSFLLPGTDGELCNFIKSKINVSEK